MVPCVSSPRSRPFRGSRWEPSRPCPSWPSPAGSPTTTRHPPTNSTTQRACWPATGPASSTSCAPSSRCRRGASPPTDTGRERLGALPTDGGRPHRRGRAPPGAPQAVRAAGRASGVDDPGTDHPRQRPLRLPDDRASPFPRHWIYDHTGRLAEKSGLIDFQRWYRRSFGRHTPWGDEQSPALVTAVESALERQLSATIIGSHPRFVRLQPGEDLVEQGGPGGRLFLLFDGVLLVLRDGRPVTEVGPGAVLGEMALLEGGRRTATLRAVTPCRVAVVPADRVERGMLERVARHRHDQTTA